ncbi:uncharacterized protein LOC107418452 [Ziziphus jujuba]|uniref:Uncharacterized protein LOC107418452 n=2 Tax=Ziziphus jujuba TaxID=326968 RepID=A0A6P4A3J2_ZIZJJ|nr:uncharacterized protein LOC107418452 [Ziziphus jujuba]KAH7528493.1 hypothetical protein FEM48_Zijuj05G0078000 [Ziziphus jujuba var. spinosa]
MGVEDQEMAHIDPESYGEGKTNALLPNTRCCFCFPCFGSRRSPTVGVAWWERMRTSSTTTNDDQWWHKGIRAFKKLREWSEIVAGPKWKTFIRRFNRNKSGSGGGGRHGNFQYDPLSYSLNFDEGPGHNGNLYDDDDYSGFRNFSIRYASSSSSVPVQPKSGGVELAKDVAVYA